MKTRVLFKNIPNRSKHCCRMMAAALNYDYYRLPCIVEGNMFIKMWNDLFCLDLWKSSFEGWIFRISTPSSYSGTTFLWWKHISKQDGSVEVVLASMHRYNLPAAGLTGDAKNQPRNQVFRQHDGIIEELEWKKNKRKIRVKRQSNGYLGELLESERKRIWHCPLTSLNSKVVMEFPELLGFRLGPFCFWVWWIWRGWFEIVLWRSEQHSSAC